jgi:hypothetical protein
MATAEAMRNSSAAVEVVEVHHRQAETKIAELAMDLEMSSHSLILRYSVVEAHRGGDPHHFH